MGRLDVTVVGLRGLPDMDTFSDPDAYVIVSIGNSRHKTTVKENEKTPTWNETFKFVVADENSEQVSVEVWDSNTVSDDLIGTYKLSLGQVVQDKPEEGWYLLQNPTGGNPEVGIILHALDFGIDEPANDAPPPQQQQQQQYQPPQQQQQQQYPPQQQQYQPQGLQAGRYCIGNQQGQNLCVTPNGVIQTPRCQEWEQINIEGHPSGPDRFVLRSHHNTYVCCAGDHLEIRPSVGGDWEVFTIRPHPQIPGAFTLGSDCHRCFVSAPDNCEGGRICSSNHSGPSEAFHFNRC